MNPSDPSNPSHPRGLPGRSFTIQFAGGLLITLGLGLPLVLRFQALQDQLDQVRNTWPEHAEQLRQHYAQWDKTIAHGVDTQLFPIPLAELWRSARSRFDADVRYDRQVKAAIELQELRSSPEFQQALATIETAKIETPPRAIQERGPASEPFCRAQEIYLRSHRDLLGKATVTLFRLPRPDALQEF